MKANLFCVLLCGFSSLAAANTELSNSGQPPSELDCFQQAFNSADGDRTVAELRAQCAQKPNDVLERRAKQEEEARYNPFTITAHKPNYLLPLSYNMRPNNLGVYGYNLQRSELKFQISFKFPIGPALWNDRIRVYGAYTNQSWWQAYNNAASAPFRETNHEPEVFAVLPFKHSALGFDAGALTVGLSHQSNGQSGLRSRSWNRLYGRLVLEKEGWVVGFKPWIRLSEKNKSNPNDPEGDDNPDIETYTGHFELGVFRRYSKNHSLTAILRHNFSSHKGAIQLGYSYPLNKRFKGYVELFDGYAESMIDYNHHNTRLGIGILLTDWL